MSPRELVTHALDRHSPRLGESDDETARGRCGHVVCGVSKARWARSLRPRRRQRPCAIPSPHAHLDRRHDDAKRHLQNGGESFSSCHFQSLETFAFRAIPSLTKRLVLELTRAEYLDRRENALALGNSGTGKTHLALALGLAACQKSYRVRFTTAAALVNELLEARDDKRLLRFQKQLAKQDLLIVDELGYVPLSKTGAELLFEIFSQRYEQASTLVTSNLPFNEWTEILGSERLTGALLDRLTHHVHILELNGDSYRLAHSKDSDQYKVINFIGVTVCNSIPHGTYRGPARLRPSVPWAP